MGRLEDLTPVGGERLSLNFEVGVGQEAAPLSSDLRFAPATFSHQGRRRAEDIRLEGNAEETVHGNG